MTKRAKVEKKSLKDKLPPIQCKGCHSKFVPVDRRQRYHSETCREKYYSQVYFCKITAEKRCPNCSSVFPTSKPGRQVYCSPECREDARRKRQENIAASISAERQTYLGDRFATLQNDSFRCTFCGKGPREGVKLEVEDNGRGGLHTVCNVCIEGKKLSGVTTQTKPV